MALIVEPNIINIARVNPDFDYYLQQSLTIIEACFTKLHNRSLLFNMFKAMYKDNQSRFTLTSPVHSNNGGIPHISLKVNIIDNISATIHINCKLSKKYLTDEVRLLADNITILYYNQLETIAVFI